MNAATGQQEHTPPGPSSWTSEPRKELIRLALPIAMSMMSYSVMTLVDTLFVGRLGPSALAAVGLGGIVAFTMICFPFGMLGGLRVLVSQSVGAGRAAGARGYLAVGMIVGLASGLAVVALGQVVALAMPLVAATESTGRLAAVYVSIRVIGAPMSMIFAAQREYRHGHGETTLPMVAAIVANVVNIVLDAVLIIGLGFGVAGAAWATVASAAVQPLIMAVATRQGGLGLAAARWAQVKALWEIGAPSGIQFLLEIGSFAAVTMIIASMSEVDMAAHQIALQVIHFSFLPAIAVGDAASILTGQAVGSSRDDLVRVVGRQAMLIAGGYALLWTLILAFGSPLIAAQFSSDGELVSLAVKLLYVAAVFQVFDAGNVIARSALRGTGDVKFTAYLGIGGAWIITPPAAWLLGVHLGLGAYGGWLGLCVEVLLMSLLFWWRLEGGGWGRAAARSRELLDLTPSPAPSIGEG